MSLTRKPIDQELAVQRAKNLRNARRGFQVSIQYIVEQVLNGNASAASQIFRAAELAVNGPDGADFTREGKAAKAYLVGAIAAGGCGLDDVLHFDAKKGAWKMRKDWQAASQKLDYAALWNNLQFVPWFTFQAPPKEKPAFDITKAMLSLAKKASAAGISPELFTLEARVAIDKAPGAVVDPRAKAETAPEHAVH